MASCRHTPSQPLLGDKVLDGETSLVSKAIAPLSATSASTETPHHCADPRSWYPLPMTPPVAFLCTQQLSILKGAGRGQLRKNGKTKRSQ